jgi:hypothetical protein
MRTRPGRLSDVGPLAKIALVALAVALVVGAFRIYRRFAGASFGGRASGTQARPRSFGTLVRGSAPRQPSLCTTTLNVSVSLIRPWKPEASLQEISEIWRGAGYRGIEEIDQQLANDAFTDRARVPLYFKKASLLSWEGDAPKSYQVFEELRSVIERDPTLSLGSLASAIYLQGVTALRRGENDNCIMCRGESSCILPIAPAARHANPIGSRLAIKHFTEYLAGFPEDLEVRWLLNLAHMTLGEYPEKVDPRYRLDLSRFFHSEFDIGRFRDVGHLVGVNRFNQAGGAIMEDFDNDGLLDIAVSSFDCTQPMSYYRNKGDGTFEDRSQAAGVTGQLGGMVCYQADYDNDGNIDIYIARGAWFPFPIRPSLLRNTGAGHFIDVTETAGLLDPANSNAACWGDFDNDGWLDLFVACEKQAHRLFHNRGDGTFEEVAAKAGLKADPALFCKGCNWIDYDNDDYPDLFVDNLKGTACLYHNNRDATFTDVTSAMGISGPRRGFSCWAWDYNNDGWLDILATCYDLALEDVVRGCSDSRTAGIRTGSIGTRGERALKMSPAKRGSTWSSARWGAITAISTTTAGWTCTSARESRAWPQSSQTGCSRTSAARGSPTSARRPAPATCKKGTAWLAATGIGTATWTSSPKPGAPSTVTNITTSSSRTPARETTGSP